MSKKDNSPVKILFRFYSSVLEQHTVETMWASVLDKGNGLYVIDTIPFHVPGIATDDVVSAKYDKDEEMLLYKHTVQHSGNSIVQVSLTDKSNNINEIRKTFSDLGCSSEKLNESYFAMEIPAEIDYKTIKPKLDELEEQKVIGYAEACLSDKHKE